MAPLIAQSSSLSPPHRSSPPSYRYGVTLDEAVDIQAGGDDALGVEGTGGDDLLDLDDDAAGGGGHRHVEVAAGAPVGEIARRIGHLRSQERHVGGEGVFEHAGTVIEHARLLA